jgi:predicted  nucleic acid-binding Zn-ribbon protein
MSNPQILQWLLFGLSLLAGIGTILAWFKLRYAERFLPRWDELKDIEAKLPVRQEELRQAGEAMSALQQEWAKLEGEVGHLRQLREWQQTNPDAPARIQQMMVDLERGKSELAAVQQKLAQDESRLSQITQEVTLFTQEKAVLTEQTKTLREQIATSQKEKSDLEKIVRDLDDQRRLMEFKATGLKGDIESQEKRVSALQQQVQQAQQKLVQDEARLNQVTQEVARLAQERNQLIEQNKALREQFGELQKRKTDLEKDLRDLDDRHRQLEGKLAGMKSDIQSQERHLDALLPQVEKAVQEKAAAIRERDQARADRESARAELEGYKKSLETYKVLLENIHAQLQQTGMGQTDIAKALEDLAQPALMFEFKRAARIDENTALSRLADHLRAKGLHFPERVRYAFHTSLKAAHINPLVVLAGVSGTGKSALPKAYAEAMGMNFVSLAVQPGWSGPQDLLGFYNYLERKYKATELARALAQMSRFSNEDLPGLEVQSRKDQMLLLLLDEMNLARIEYYFSDFLSRLEQRRGQKVDDAQRRREISLLVDAGSLPAGQAPRFIFPDFNVLFVGTMNEDESTQSLSDKVIDRANVLRFGAPKDLKAEKADTIAPATEWLPRATWETQWVKRYTGTGFDEERDVLRKLNESLETIHRPFGHRVYRAILDYLANYPGADNDQEKLRHALADQFEQKIVPKLRGLDTHDEAVQRCLDDIAGAISKLGDKDLESAFGIAREQPLFEWFGVKRS